MTLSRYRQLWLSGMDIEWRKYHKKVNGSHAGPDRNSLLDLILETSYTARTKDQKDTKQFFMAPLPKCS